MRERGDILGKNCSVSRNRNHSHWLKERGIDWKVREFADLVVAQLGSSQRSPLGHQRLLTARPGLCLRALFWLPEQGLCTGQVGSASELKAQLGWEAAFHQCQKWGLWVNIPASSPLSWGNPEASSRDSQQIHAGVVHRSNLTTE